MSSSDRLIHINASDMTDLPFLTKTLPHVRSEDTFLVLLEDVHRSFCGIGDSNLVARAFRANFGAIVEADHAKHDGAQRVARLRP